MISSFYAALAAFLLIGLSLNVIKLRTRNKVSLGDGNHADLQAAIRAQGNASEYIPTTLILLILLELNHGSAILLHAGGIALLAGRLIHAKGLITEQLRYRIIGMQLTFITLASLALANIGYLIYHGLQDLSHAIGALAQ